MTTSS
ncbi:hypothetical protein Zm00014a_041376 [Zea mays]